jgi:hypothetical protein
MLYENLKRNYNIPEAPAEEKTEQNTDGNSETSKL